MCVKLRTSRAISTPFNYKRWFDICEECNKFLWYNPPTALHLIPEDVQIRCTIKKLAKEDGDGDNSLFCPVDGCRTAAKNEPRKANKGCLRPIPHCSGCCKAAGGCALRAHRVSSSVGDSPAETPSPSINTPPVAVRREYARPFDPNYAKPYIASHGHLSTESIKAAADEKAKDLSYVVIWSKASLSSTLQFVRIQILISMKNADSGPYAPARFKFINERSGHFIPNFTPPIVAASAASTLPNFISVLDFTTAQPTWVGQNLQCAIAVSKTSQVLLRTCDITADSDCLELESEILLYGSPLTANPIPAIVGSKSRAFTSRGLLDVSLSSTPGPSNLSVAPTSRQFKRRFPVQYTCEMVPVMLALSGIKNDGPALRSAFEEHVPGAEFVQQTVYRNVALYKSAVRLGIFEKYIKFARTTDGKWSNVRNEVGQLTLKPTAPKAMVPMTIDLTGDEIVVEPDSVEVVPDLDSGPLNTLVIDDTSELQTHLRRMSTYCYIDAYFQDYLPPNIPNINLEMVVNHGTQGHKFVVTLATFTYVGYPQLGAITIAVKQPLCDSDWLLFWPSMSTAVWTEGARLATCHDLWTEFGNVARGLGVELPDYLTVVETSYISPVAEGDDEWLGQPWHMGTQFSIHSLDANIPADVDVANVLSAFSHFTFQRTNHRSVFVDFQGLKTHNNRYVILDSVTHVSQSNIQPVFDQYGEDVPPPPYSVNSAPHFLGSLGDVGLEAFETSHNCTALCGRLQLNSLPLAL
ncbi:hypothetical protein R3P38DRAFT_3354906 [Favolaschia claudopus]|uniref:Alpha-type protein kinase domain-containing protein n=1 Tax=Favolaschia claudopus TaxID=2862362 RepID=A0AAW0BL56_9AGAR